MQKPDIFAVTKDRKSIEIEVKVDWSDFVNDRKKRKWRFEGEQHTWCHWPWQFYYLVPPAMCFEARQYLEKNSSLWKVAPGLLTLSEGCRNDWNQNIEMINVQMAPQINKLSEKLAIKQISELVKCQSGTVCSILSKLAVQNNQQDPVAVV